MSPPDLEHPGHPLRPAVVLSCEGAPVGDLALVRNLAARGVPVWVISEYAQAPTLQSRRAAGHRLVPRFSQAPQRLLEALRALRDELGIAPVVFPTADPDLAALIQLHDQLEGVAISVVIDPAMSAGFSDKQAFDQLVRRLQLPVPRTARLGDATLPAAERPSRYPFMLKPARPNAWHQARLDTPLGQTLSASKAWRVDDAAGLAEIGDLLLAAGADTLVQEYVPGADEAHVSVHAYVDRTGQVQALCSGRKWRIYPPHAGSGCFVQAVALPELEALAAELLGRIGYRGVATMNFKQHASSGDWLLLEINPRISQWHLLPTRAGVDLPWLAYADACGLAPSRPTGYSRTGLYYLNEAQDWQALRIYRREGLLSLGRWAAQLLGLLLRGRLVLQWLDLGDARPALHTLAQALRRRWRALRPD
ncbi:MAG: hypothetical protein RL722_392 [Pseudomonadota bacterium]|jgi:predicted ATP-grasp superfamily ATP-dependent carboligase